MNTNALSAASQPSSGWFDFFAVMGAIVLVALATLLWVILVRKKKSPHRRHRHHRPGYRERFKKNADEIKQLVQPRQRRHREHHPLNPTLAQTGGLPPAREEVKSADQPPPTSQP
jgi:hypothetical protein